MHSYRDIVEPRWLPWCELSKLDDTSFFAVDVVPTSERDALAERDRLGPHEVCPDVRINSQDIVRSSIFLPVTMQMHDVQT